MNREAEEAFVQARAKLCLMPKSRGAFWATLVFRLEPGQDEQQPTACTDGKRLLYNPVWWLGMKLDERVGILAHEAGHVALKHHVRMAGRSDGKRWNVAADLALNSLLIDSGFKLPAGGLFPRDMGFPLGLSAEEYYDLLDGQDKGQGEEKGGKEDDGQGEAGQPGEGEGPRDVPGDPGGLGGVMPPKDCSPAGLAEAAQEAETLVRQAEAASRMRGEMPADVQRLVGLAVQSQTDWRAELAEFLARTRDDYSWSRPNRRFIHQGIILPSLESTDMGPLVVAIDTSGSISRKILDIFAAEVQALVQLNPRELIVVFHDSVIQAEQRWSPGEAPLVLAPRGGGGTSHIGVFDFVEKLDEEPCAVIALTDLYTEFPRCEPGVLVLWAVPCGPGYSPPEAPWGRVVQIRGQS